MNGNNRRNQQLLSPFIPHVNDFELLTDEKFRAQYRLSKEAVLTLLSRIECGLLAHVRISGVPPINQLLLTLLYYATGPSFLKLGASLGITKSIAWRIVHQVSTLIALLDQQVIHFPVTDEGKTQAQAELFQVSGFPRVIACLDAKQVKVESFGEENAECFRNCDENPCISVQLMCNARLEFVDIAARWPGPIHESTMLKNSLIYSYFEEGKFGDSLIVGDRGYPERPYLMTPLRAPKTAAEISYNEALFRTRHCIDQATDLWKERFPVIGSIGLRFQDFEHTLAVIVATVVCHNIELFTNPVNHTAVNLDRYRAIHDSVQLGPGKTFRERLITGYFQEYRKKRRLLSFFAFMPNDDFSQPEITNFDRGINPKFLTSNIFF